MSPTCKIVVYLIIDLLAISSSTNISSLKPLADDNVNDAVFDNDNVYDNVYDNDNINDNVYDTGNGFYPQPTADKMLMMIEIIIKTMFMIAGFARGLWLMFMIKLCFSQKLSDF